ncbi:MAG: hypothetical protein K0R48_134 [Gammaproteobacteria bacterium]|jgi:type II secretory pathway pseudopilin PulG|nr:hypothetical protein [Gammaproteobacteria bacterium]
MQFKHTSSGLTLIEIMLSLVIASLILLYLIPQQLKSSREQMTNQTIAEMNQIVLAARNYYQDKYNASPTAVLATLWPQTLVDLSTNNYLPSAALCSPWPSSQKDATPSNCGYQLPYTIFPANTSNAYDTTAGGIVANGLNKGGNFWGVSITLPNATIAQAVEQKLPFATLCSPNQLKNGFSSTSCTGASNTVTAIVPRPAQWPEATNVTYANEGLIQSVANDKGCSDIHPQGSNPCNYFANSKYVYQNNLTNYVPMPNCGTNTPVIFLATPSRMQTFKGAGYTKSSEPTDLGLDATQVSDNTKPGFGLYYPGDSVKITRDDTNKRWVVQRRYSSDTSAKTIGAVKFHHFSLVYFTVCAPTGDPGKWDPSNFIGASTYGVSWPDTYIKPGTYAP